jgi:hypothetical protein
LTVPHAAPLMNHPAQSCTRCLSVGEDVDFRAVQVGCPLPRAFRANQSDDHGRRLMNVATRVSHIQDDGVWAGGGAVGCYVSLGPYVRKEVNRACDCTERCQTFHDAESLTTFRLSRCRHRR